MAESAMDDARAMECERQCEEAAFLATECDEACAGESAPGGGGGAAASSSSSSSPGRTANATVKYWQPDTPYLKAIQLGKTTAEQYAMYLQQRAEYVKTPAFYFDVGGFFMNPDKIDAERRMLGIRVLSNIAELGLDNSRILRVLGYKLHEATEYELASEIFCRVAQWRPQEAQSFRDLALTMIERGWYQPAIELLWRTITMDVNPDFAEIEVEAIWECRDCLARANRAGVPVELPALLKANEETFLAGDMPLDVRITLGWDSDNVDIDLHVIEPTSEEAYYGHKLTEMGGLMSRDFRRGYGPESYVLKRALPGKYRIKTNYFSSSAPTLTGPCVAIVTIYTNFCRPNQTMVNTLIRLNEAKDNGEIASVTIS
jgi:hypothetical protein